MAQGFVSAQLQESLILHGGTYWSMLGRSFKGCWDGRVKSYKMHELLHDVVVPEQTKCSLKGGEQSGKKAANECQGLRRILLMKNKIP